MIKCNNCNNHIPNDSEFCQYCGSSITSLPNKNADEENATKADILISPPVTFKTNVSNKNTLSSIACALSLCLAIIMWLMYFNLSSKYNQLQKESTQQKHQITLLQNNINDLEREYIQVNKKYKFIASFVNENFYMLSKYDSNYHLINCAYILNRGYTRYSSNDYASLPTPMCRLCYEAMVETYN